MGIKNTIKYVSLAGLLTATVGAVSGIDRGIQGVGYEFIGLPYRVANNIANIGVEYYTAGKQAIVNSIDSPREALAIGSLSTVGTLLIIYATRPRRREEPQPRRQAQTS